jgi:serine protease Do
MKKLWLLCLFIVAATVAGHGWSAPPKNAAPAAASSPEVVYPAAAALEAQTMATAPKCVASTVGLVIRGSGPDEKQSASDGSGSGVVVSADGLILTVAHVVQVPGTPVTIRFSDGRVVQGVSLGMDHEVDTGMVRITDAAPAGGWPFSPLAPADSARPGEWVLATGHPGSIVVDRNPPVRLGRVTQHDENDVVSNCPIEPGDSGGPLFDLSGRVVAISTAIGGTGYDEGRPTGWVSHHVPISLFSAKWKDLLAGKQSHPEMRHEEGDDSGFDVEQLEEAVKKLAAQKDSEALKLLEQIRKDGGHLHVTDAQAARLIKKAGIEPGAEAAQAPGVPTDLRPFFRPGVKHSLLHEAPGAQITDALLDRILDKAHFDLATGRMQLMPDAEVFQAMGIPPETIARLFGEAEPATRLIRQYERTSLQTLSLIAPALDAAGNCVVEVWSDDKPIALGTVVDADGWIATKASELRDRPTVVLPDGTSLEAKVAGKDQATDLALLKIEAQGLTAAQFSDAAPLGAWLASPVRDANRPAVGVVSVVARPIPKEFAHFQGNSRVILGLAVAGNSCTVEDLTPGMPAEKAGVKVGDVVISVNGKPFSDPTALVARVLQATAGETLTLQVRRAGKVLELNAVLGEAKTVVQTDSGIGEEDEIAAGQLSQRRTDFPLAIQHDAAVWAEECGGPLLNLQGKTVGINIARYDQVCTFAVPADLVQKTVARLRDQH